jgi:polyhydroxybutyrate depolymerase
VSRRRVTLGVVAVSLAWAIGPASAISSLTAPGSHDLSLRDGRRERTFVVHTPPGAGTLPVLVAFHGGGGNARGFSAYAGLDVLSDREGFVVVYPDGTGPLARRLLTWNAGGCCGDGQRQDVDDVAFTLAVLRRVASELPIDATRVYATGHSNGAMMAYRLGAEAAERIAAIAPVAGAMTLDRFAPSRPMPVLDIHSFDDPRALYAGGVGPPFPGTDIRVTHPPTLEALERWIVHDGCPAESRQADERHTRAGARVQTATLLVHEPCASGAVVAHWRLSGVGHGWPGSHSALPERIMGPDTTVIDAGQEVWRFVRRFSRPDAPSLR